MKSLAEILTGKFSEAFEACGYDASLGQVQLSNRPDLCDFQCNGSMAGAKKYKKAPIMIANEVLAKTDISAYGKAEAIAPGFINIKLSNSFLAAYVLEMSESKDYGFEKATKPLTIMMDYGGPNVAKPLHVGHLRPAIIGESVKRIARFAGHNVISDVHLGDWGMPVGLVIAMLQERKPDLIYFDDNYEGEYPEEAPFTVSDLEEMYPAASARKKTDEEFSQRAHDNTVKLQDGHRGFRAIWKHIFDVSVADIKKNYEKLNVSFDLWKGESNAQPYIEDMINEMVASGLAYESEGALVVDIREEGDSKEFPPCIVRKSDGASIYQTTDLATLVEREKLYHPDRVIYVVDKRQSLHFTQVFRTARKAGIVRPETELLFLGNGTLNGKDGTPYKTRDGGVPRLEYLIREISDVVYEKLQGRADISEEEAKDIARKVGLAALKYGDLSNQLTKDYIFDMERFTSFEGNTGPYVLYTMVRIKSILAKCTDFDGVVKEIAEREYTDSERALLLEITKFSDMIKRAYEESAPHKVCQFIYDLSNSFNAFYHENKIISEEDQNKKNEWIGLLKTVLGLLGIGIDLLGFEAPDRM
ncbi:MAG: arginine--tRNA ligase [Lachnospiraceae bacterium]|nr:arginine--tRNA ligase [Lachnospiraceae bacterium]